MTFPSPTDEDLKENLEAGVGAVLDELTTPFNSVKTAEQNIQFAIDPSKGLTRRRYSWYSNNTLYDNSFLTHDDSEGTLVIDIDTSNTDTGRIRSALVGQYISQSLAQPGVGFRINPNNISRDSNNLVSTDGGIAAVGAGWHDGSSGGWGVGGPVQTFLGMKFDSSGAEAILVSNGSHIDDSPVPQDEWNIDKMDGSGGNDNPSGKILKPEDGYVYNFPYTWYAYGALFVGVVHPEADKPIFVHRFDSFAGSSLDRPNLVPMVITDNNGATSSLNVSVGGMQYALYGADVDRVGENRALETSRVTSGTYISDQVATTANAIDPNAQVGKPLIAVRRDETANVRDLAMSLDEVIPEPDVDVYIYAWDEYDDATALDGTWREPNEPITSSETLSQVNTECTTYTPTKAVMRGWDKATTAKKNEETLNRLTTDDRIPIDATRVYTVVHDGSGGDIEVRVRAVEGY